MHCKVKFIGNKTNLHFLLWKKKLTIKNGRKQCFDSIIGHNQLNDENENKKLAHYYYMYCIIYTSKNCNNM